MPEVQDELGWLAANHVRFIAIRRNFYAYPEIGFDENWTAQQLEGLLTALGCTISGRIGGTGFVATLQGGQGRAVALRTY